MKPIPSLLSVLGATAASTLMLPAFANTATEQVGTQSATINGNNNQIIQVINQVNVNHPGLGQGRTNNPRRSSTTTIQDSYQGVGIEGSGNAVYQESNQVNVEERAQQPGRRGGADRPNENRYDDDDGKSRGQGRGHHDNRGRGDDDDDDDDD